MAEKFLYRVWHPVHGNIEVIGSDRYWALVEAAKEWGLRWRTIARDVVITDLGRPRAFGKEKAHAENQTK